jgi:hypothetical protein
MDVHDLMLLAKRRITAHPSQEGCNRYLHLSRCPTIPYLSPGSARSTDLSSADVSTSSIAQQPHQVLLYGGALQKN